MVGDLASAVFVSGARRQRQRVAEAAFGAARSGRALVPALGCIEVAQLFGAASQHIGKQRLALRRAGFRGLPGPVQRRREIRFARLVNREQLLGRACRAGQAIIGALETTTPRTVTTWSTGISPMIAISATTRLAMIQTTPRAERGIGALTIAVDGHWNSSIAGKVGSAGSPRRRRTGTSAFDDVSLIGLSRSRSSPGRSLAPPAGRGLG